MPEKWKRKNKTFYIDPNTFFFYNGYFFSLLSLKSCQSRAYGQREKTKTVYFSTAHLVPKHQGSLQDEGIMGNAMSGETFQLCASYWAMCFEDKPQQCIYDQQFKHIISGCFPRCTNVWPYVCTSLPLAYCLIWTSIRKALMRLYVLPAQ